MISKRDDLEILISSSKVDLFKVIFFVYSAAIDCLECGVSGRLEEPYADDMSLNPTTFSEANPLKLKIMTRLGINLNAEVKLSKLVGQLSDELQRSLPQMIS